MTHRLSNLLVSFSPLENRVGYIQLRAFLRLIAGRNTVEKFEGLMSLLARTAYHRASASLPL